MHRKRQGMREEKEDLKPKGRHSDGLPGHPVAVAMTQGAKQERAPSSRQDGQVTGNQFSGPHSAQGHTHTDTSFAMRRPTYAVGRSEGVTPKTSARCWGLRKEQVRKIRVLPKCDLSPALQWFSVRAATSSFGLRDPGRGSCHYLVPIDYSR